MPTRKVTVKKRKPQTKRDVILAAWEDRRRPSVGAQELREIQRALGRSLGPGAVDSPAAIARVLADEGAELRHPEVIEFDARWREASIKRGAVAISATAEKPLTLSQGTRLIAKLEKERQKFERTADGTNLHRQRIQAIKDKQYAESLARSTRLSDQTRSEQAEIAEWLRVWLQTPQLFSDWLDLRMRSAEFRQQFPANTPELKPQA